MFTNVDKNLLIAALESALLYGQNTVGVSSLEELTSQIALLRAAFDTDPATVTDEALEAMITKLQALEIPNPATLSRLLTTSNITGTTSYLAVCSWATLLNKPATFTPSEHGHNWSEILYKPNTYPSTWDILQDKPLTFPPGTHAHSFADVTDKPATFPPGTHAHSFADVTDKPATFAPDVHAHSYTSLSDIPTSFVSTWALVSGKPTSFVSTWTLVSGKPTSFAPRLNAVTYTGNGSTPRNLAFTGGFVAAVMVCRSSSGIASILWPSDGLEQTALTNVAIITDSSANTNGVVYRALILG